MPGAPKDSWTTTVQSEGVPSRKYQNAPIMDDVENIEEYEPGGFAPPYIGDALGNRFQIIHQLGFGGHVIVWLCWKVSTERRRAIKVKAARRSSKTCAGLMAIQHMKDEGTSQEELEFNHIAMPIDTFWHHSYNGRHLCLVMPVLGPKLID